MVIQPPGPCLLDFVRALQRLNSMEPPVSHSAFYQGSLGTVSLKRVAPWTWGRTPFLTPYGTYFLGGTTPTQLLPDVSHPCAHVYFSHSTPGTVTLWVSFP